MSLICVVHYNNHEKYSNIKSLSDVNKQRILEAKRLREEVEGENHHEDQCSSIPQIFTDAHGIHLEPCYKKYVLNYISFSFVYLLRFQVRQETLKVIFTT